MSLCVGFNFSGYFRVQSNLELAFLFHVGHSWGTKELMSTMKNTPPTQEQLRNLFNYDPETGVLIRLVSVSWNTAAGDVAGSPDRDGYLWVRIRGRLYPVHRLIWLYTYGVWPKWEIDHENGNTSDNRLVNLRDATHQQNNTNKPMRADNTSGVTGVHWHAHTKKWKAEIRLDSRAIYLGVFSTIEAAKAVYDAKAKELFGEFRRTA